MCIYEYEYMNIEWPPCRKSNACVYAPSDWTMTTLASYNLQATHSMCPLLSSWMDGTVYCINDSAQPRRCLHWFIACIYDDGSCDDVHCLTPTTHASYMHNPEDAIMSLYSGVLDHIHRPAPECCLWFQLLVSFPLQYIIDFAPTTHCMPILKGWSPAAWTHGPGKAFRNAYVIIAMRWRMWQDIETNH